jgi:hypothetical protein
MATPLAPDLPARLACVTLLVATLLSGCGSTPLSEDSLHTSEELFAMANETPEIYRYASSNMRQAHRYLQSAAELADEGGSQDELEHLTFLARQHVAIAEARLRRGLTEAKINNADQRRETLVLASEQRQAAAAEEQLSEMRAKLVTSERRAQALAEKLREMGVSDEGP